MAQISNEANEMVLSGERVNESKKFESLLLIAPFRDTVGRGTYNGADDPGRADDIPGSGWIRLAIVE